MGAAPDPHVRQRGIWIRSSSDFPLLGLVTVTTAVPSGWAASALLCAVSEAADFFSFFAFLASFLAFLFSFLALAVRRGLGLLLQLLGLLRELLGLLRGLLGLGQERGRAGPSRPGRRRPGGRRRDHQVAGATGRDPSRCPSPSAVVAFCAFRALLRGTTSPQSTNVDRRRHVGRDRTRRQVAGERDREGRQGRREGAGGAGRQHDTGRALERVDRQRLALAGRAGSRSARCRRRRRCRRSPSPWSKIVRKSEFVEPGVTGVRAISGRVAPSYVVPGGLLGGHCARAGTVDRDDVAGTGGEVARRDERLGRRVGRDRPRVQLGDEGVVVAGVDELGVLLGEELEVEGETVAGRGAEVDAQRSGSRRRRGRSAPPSTPQLAARAVGGVGVVGERRVARGDDAEGGPVGREAGQRAVTPTPVGHIPSSAGVVAGRRPRTGSPPPAWHRSRSPYRRWPSPVRPGHRPTSTVAPARGRHRG